MTGLQTRILSDDTAFAELRDVWNALLDATPNGTPWQSFELSSSWWQHLRGTRQLRIIVVERDGRICLLLPLQLSAVTLMSMRLRALEPLGMPDDINRPSFALGRAQPDAWEAAGRALWSMRGEWDLLRVDERTEADTDFQALRQFATHHGLLFRSQALHPCPVLTIAGKWEDYLQSRGQRMRKNLRAARRQLESVGPVRLEDVHGADRIDQALDIALDIYQRSWKGSAQLGLAQSDAYRSFTRDVLRQMAQQGCARILILWSGPCPVAATIAFMRGDAYYSAHIAHDENYARYSPGTLLESLELEGLFNAGRFKTYDFLGAALANKRRWTDTMRPTQRLLVMRPSIRTHLMDAWFFRLKPTLKRVRARLRRPYQEA
jgi:CelD/BcsL family acetyltransferase involved in cellulose biosynthesis